MLLVALIAVLFVSACRRSSGASVTLRGTDTGRTIELKRGDKLIVELEGNPTTGFQWEAMALDTAILKQEGDPEWKTDQPGLLGSEVTCTLKFGVLRAGRTELRLVYHQPWDKETPPAQTFEVTVVVE